MVWVALALAALLNAPDLEATARRQELGWKRDAALAVVSPLRRISSVLMLDRPRLALDVALGRVEPEEPTPEAVASPVGGAAEAVDPDAVAAAPIGPVLRSGPATAADPLVLHIAGDSMAAQFGPALANLAEDSGLAVATVDYEFESGLTRPDFVDWPARLARAETEHDPDVVVLLFGGNDGQDIQLDGGGTASVGEPEWSAEYGSRVRAVLDQLVEDGRRVVWIGMPPVRSETFQPRVDVMNSVYESVTADVPGVEYIDVAPVFEGPDGGYSEFLPDDDGEMVDMRLNDGVHYTTAGGERLADVVWARIAEFWPVPDAPQ